MAGREKKMLNMTWKEYTTRMHRKLKMHTCGGQDESTSRNWLCDGRLSVATMWGDDGDGS